MARRIVTGLDIGTTSIKVVVAEHEGERQLPKVLSLVKKPSRGLRRGYIVNIEETSDAIREALTEASRETQLTIKRVVLGIGGANLDSVESEGGVAIARPDGEITEPDVERSLADAEAKLTDMHNRDIIHRIPVSFRLDGEKVLGRIESQRGQKLESKALFVTCGRQQIADFVRSVEETGVVIDRLVAAPIAAAQVTLSKVQKAAGCVLANVGSQTTSIIVYEDGIPIHLHTFPVGSTDVTNDIALGFRVPLDEAERIKRGEITPTGPKKKLDEIIEARLSDIFELIEVHLKKLRRNGLLPAGIVITGGGSHIPNIDLIAKNYLKLPAAIAQPQIAPTTKNQIKDPGWAVAYGLCVFGTDSEDESLGTQILSGTKKGLIRWLKELMP